MQYDLMRYGSEKIWGKKWKTIKTSGKLEKILKVLELEMPIFFLIHWTLFWVEAKKSILCSIFHWSIPLFNMAFEQIKKFDTNWSLEYVTSKLENEFKNKKNWSRINNLSKNWTIGRRSRNWAKIDFLTNTFYPLIFHQDPFLRNKFKLTKMDFWIWENWHHWLEYSLKIWENSVENSG